MNMIALLTIEFLTCDIKKRISIIADEYDRAITVRVINTRY